MAPFDFCTLRRDKYRLFHTLYNTIQENEPLYYQIPEPETRKFLTIHILSIINIKNINSELLIMYFIHYPEIANTYPID